MKPIVLIVGALLFAVLIPLRAHSQGKVLRSVSNDSLEKILKGMDVKYQRGERKEKDVSTTYFDFTRGSLPTRMYNYGNDLWLESTVDKKMTLEDVNRWNAQAKFSRLVLIEQKDKVTVSLEAQLDCLGGVTEAAIKQFVNRFDQEATKFSKFVK
ncbi:MAG: YbjN domain-containing protein [Planctomycetes bacterium]|nr:YbjN domain-containing protein [Planctomycetota bacterium]